MDVDFPAAHSMDTTFFAIDAAGHVAVFFTGESGPAPADAEQGDLFDLLPLVPAIPPELSDPETADWSEAMEAIPEYGLFCYEANEEEDLPLQPQYEQYGRPDNPLHVDQLPPQARKLVKKYLFADLRFSENEQIQLLQHLECQTWGDYCAGYLCEDGKTVKPVPGKEKDFAAFAEMVCRDFPKESANLHFEGIEQPQRKNRPRKKKKSDEGE